MGRTLKRVPLDFKHPIGKIWEGYLTTPKQDPPSGEGYQLWETTSEGSPITPVFKTLDELCEHAAENCSTFGTYTATKEQWKKMLSEDKVYATDGNITYI